MAKVCSCGGVGLKIIVWRGGGKGSKFEFEASSAEVAEEVAEEVSEEVAEGVVEVVRRVVVVVVGESDRVRE